MLFYIVVWVFIAIPCLLTGFAILSLIDSTVFERIGERFIIAIWLGVMVFAIALQAISLFSPLLPAIGLLLFLLGSLAPLKLRSVRAELLKLKSAISRTALILGGALIFVVATYTSQPPIYFDTGLYHLQSILWLAEYGAVPGAALIHDRLGFTSSWFALAAPFHHGELKLRSVAILGGFVITMQVIHFVIATYRIVGKRARLEDWFIAIATLLIIPVPFGYLMAVSSSPDLPMMALTVLVPWVMLVIVDGETTIATPSKLNVRLVPLILAASAVTLKLNALPMLAISLLFFVFGGGPLLKRIFVGLSVAGGVVASQIISGLIISGCPLYPGPICCNLPWSVGTISSEKIYAGLLSYARWRNYFVSADAPGWLWTWLRNEQGLVLLLICSVISVAVIFYSKRKSDFNGATWIISLAALGVAWALYSLPNPRFLIGYLQLIPAFIASRYPLVCSPAIFIMQLIPETDLKHRLARFLTLIVSVIAYAIILRFKHTTWAMKASFAFLALTALLPVKVVLVSMGSKLVMNRENISSWLIPPAAPKLIADELIKNRVNDIEYVIPKAGRPYEQQCWATDLPCTPQLTQEDIKLRDPMLGLKGGFVRNNRIE